MKPVFIKCEDGSILIEWIHKNCRFGITLESNREESGWYFVSNDLIGITESGELPEQFLDLFKEKIS